MSPPTMTAFSLQKSDVGDSSALQKSKVALANLIQLATYICQAPIALIDFTHSEWRQVIAPINRPPFGPDFRLPYEQIKLTASGAEVEGFEIQDTLANQQLIHHPIVEHEPHIRFVCGAPLKTIDGQVVGFFCLIDRVPHALTSVQKQVLRLLADQVMMQLDQYLRIGAIQGELATIKQQSEALEIRYHHMQQIMQQLERTNQQQQQLNRFSIHLQTCVTFKEMQIAIRQFMPALFPHSSGRIYLQEGPDGKRFTLSRWGEAAVRLGSPPGWERCPAFEQTISLTGTDDCLLPIRQELQETAPWFHPLTNAPPDWSPRMCAACLQSDHPQPEDSLHEQVLCTPLKDQGEVLGIFQIRQPSGSAWTFGDYQLGLQVAEQIAITLKHLTLLDTLRIQSIRDPLTGLFNRRYMMETLEHLMQTNRGSPNPLSLIMLDIDHFKQINDTYGHQAGDTVLKDLSLFIKGQIRATDLACRYGGEEFAIILPRSAFEVGLRRAEKLRTGIRYITMSHLGRRMGTLTLSLGVAGFPHHGTTPQMLIEAADRALYEAKNQGRDRVMGAQA